MFLLSGVLAAKLPNPQNVRRASRRASKSPLQFGAGAHRLRDGGAPQVTAETPGRHGNALVLSPSATCPSTLVTRRVLHRGSPRWMAPELISSLSQGGLAPGPIDERGGGGYLQRDFFLGTCKMNKTAPSFARAKYGHPDLQLQMLWRSPAPSSPGASETVAWTSSPLAACASSSPPGSCRCKNTQWTS